MMQNDAIPTRLAERIAIKCDLLMSKKTGLNHVKYTEQFENLEAFQNMSISCPFEKCLVAYYDVELSQEQIEALKIIHRSTNDWLLGHVVSALVHRINSGVFGNKELAQVATLILEQINNEENGNKKPTAAVKGLVVKLAKTTEN